MSEQGYLDRETYEKLSCRTQPMFAGHRPILYDVFLSYLAAKQELGDFDASERSADFTIMPELSLILNL